jgi:hypothetical protein
MTPEPERNRIQSQLLLKLTCVAWVDVYWHDSVLKQKFMHAAIGERRFVHSETGLQRGAYGQGKTPHM